MPTTALTPIAGPSVVSTTGKGLTFTAADVGNGNHFAASQLQLVLARNVGGSSRTVTINSEPLPGPYPREADVTAQAIAAGAMRIFKLPYDGWANTSTGRITLSANHADVEFCVVDLTQESLTA